MSLTSDEWADKAKWSSGPMVLEVRSAIDSGADVNETNEDGRSPLMLACSYCVDPEVVSLLLSKGAKFATADGRGRTALHHLASLNTSKVASSYAKALLASGADPRDKDAAGATPLTDAKKKKNVVVLSVLEEWSPPPPSSERLESVRRHGWYVAWRQLMCDSIDKAFAADASSVDVLGLVAADEDAIAHHEVRSGAIGAAESFHPRPRPPLPVPRFPVPRSHGLRSALVWRAALGTDG